MHPRLVLRQNNEGEFVIPAQEGTQLSPFWVPAVPACAGMTDKLKLLM
ncbi:MAG: hypothetical protein JNM43_22180 [Planctomycetaceae bacterium]|nr:hypothetical protein [Planctomycetaceae bacterium]